MMTSLKNRKFEIEYTIYKKSIWCKNKYKIKSLLELFFGCFVINFLLNKKEFIEPENSIRRMKDKESSWTK
jgi:hypothetical protein